MPISALDKNTIKLITTSQIITSVYSAVKELLENALDASARNVEINLVDNGLSLIEVKDDGCGISKKDVPFMALPSYTSKISRFEDLGALHSYGFRGEALSALCAVADVSVITRTNEDDAAMLYTFDRNGCVAMSELCHRSIGTTVQVKQLFKYLPVRRQIILNSRKLNQDIKSIEWLIKEFGICKPSIRISYKVNNSVIFMKPSMYNIKEAAMYIIGKNIVTRMEWIQYENEEITMQLMIPCKTIQEMSELCKQNQQYVFINNRPVKYKEIVKVINESIMEHYGEKISYKTKPIFLLYMLVDPADIDVNLEPNKSTVLLKDKQKFVDIIDACMRNYYGIQPKEIEQESIYDESTTKPYEDYISDTNNAEEEPPVCKKRKLDNKIVDGDNQENDINTENAKNVINDNNKRSKITNVDKQDERQNNKTSNSENPHVHMEQIVHNEINFNDTLGSITSSLIPPVLSDSESNDADESHMQVAKNDQNLQNNINNIDHDVRSMNFHESNQDIMQMDSDPINESPNEAEIETLSQLPVVDLGEDFDLDAIESRSHANINKHNITNEQNIKREKIDKEAEVDKEKEKKVKSKQISLETWSKGQVPGLKGGTDVKVIYALENSKPSPSRSLQVHNQSLIEDSACMGFKNFSKTIRPKVVKENPTLTFVQVAQKMTELWKKLSPEERGYYRDLAKEELVAQKKKLLTEKQGKGPTMRTIIPWDVNIHTVTNSFMQSLQCKRRLSNFVIGQLEANLWFVQSNAQIWILDSSDFKTNEDRSGNPMDAQTIEKLLKQRLALNQDLSMMHPVFNLTRLEDLYEKT